MPKVVACPASRRIFYCSAWLRRQKICLRFDRRDSIRDAFASPSTGRPAACGPHLPSRTACDRCWCCSASVADRRRCFAAVRVLYKQFWRGPTTLQWTRNRSCFLRYQRDISNVSHTYVAHHQYEPHMRCMYTVGTLRQESPADGWQTLQCACTTTFRQIVSSSWCSIWKRPSSIQSWKFDKPRVQCQRTRVLARRPSRGS